MKRLVRLRRGETRRGLARLGARDAPLRFLNWHDGALNMQGRHHRLRAILIGLGVETALVSSPRDFHADHKAAFALVARATTNTMISVGTYEVWSRVDLCRVRAREPGLALKKWAAAAHRSQLGRYIIDDPSAFIMDGAALIALVSTPERYQMLLPLKTRNKGRKPPICVKVGIP